MKLHIPHPLRKAILSAIAAMGSLSQAQADISFNIERSSNADWAGTGITFTGEIESSSLSFSYISTVANSTGSVSAGAWQSPVSYPDSYSPYIQLQNNGADSWTLNFSITNNSEKAPILLQGLELDGYCFNGGGSDKNTDIAAATTLTRQGGQSYQNTVEGYTLAYEGNSSASVFDFGAQGLTLAAGETATFSFTMVNTGLHNTFSGLTGGRLLAANELYYWAGGSGNWSDSHWRYTDGGDSTVALPGIINTGIILGAGEASAIALDDDTTTHIAALSVEGGDYTLTGNNATLQVYDSLTLAGSLALADGVTLHLGGTVGMQSGAALRLAEQSTLLLNSGGDITALLSSTTGSGDIIITKDSTFAGSTYAGSPATTTATGWLKVQQGATFYLGAELSPVPLYLDASGLAGIELDGSTLWYRGGVGTLNTLSTVGDSPSVFHIQAVDGTEDEDFTEGLTVEKSTLEADLTIQAANQCTLTLKQISGSGNLTLAGNSSNQAINRLHLSTTADYTGTISIANDSNVTVNLQLEENAATTIKGTEGDQLNATQLNATLENNAKLLVDGTNGQLVEVDSISVSEGAQGTLSAAAGSDVQIALKEISSGNLTLGSATADTVLTAGTIANAGSLTLGGTLVLSGALSDYTQYDNGGELGYTMGEDSRNGFLINSGKRYYLAAGGSNALGSTTTATLDVQTEDTLLSNTAVLSVVQDTQDKLGGIIFDTGRSYSPEFYVQEGVVNQEELLADAGSMVTEQTIYLLNGGTLQITRDIGNNLIQYTTGTVELSEDTTLRIENAANGAAALMLNTTGSGHMALSTDLTLSGTASTRSNGKLLLANSILRLGTTAADEISLASLSEVELQGNSFLGLNEGTISLSNLRSTSANNSLELGNARATLRGTTTLGGALSVYAQAAGSLTIEQLSGAGTLDINVSDYAEDVTISIEDQLDFSGRISVTNAQENTRLNISENLGLNIWFNTGGTYNLLGIGGGNTLHFNGNTNCALVSGTVAANLNLIRPSSGAALWLGKETEALDVTFTGSISGSGNLGIGDCRTELQKLSFSGDVSGWTGALRSFYKESTLVFNEESTLINLKAIDAIDSATTHVKLQHNQAVTVNSNFTEIREDAEYSAGSMHIEVSNSSSEGTTFTGSIQAGSFTVTENSTATITGSSINIATLEVQGNLTLTTADSMSVENLSVGSTGTLSLGSIAATNSTYLEGGATIAATLDLSQCSSLSLDGCAPITVLGDLVLSSPLELDGSILAALATLEAGTYLEVFNIAGELTLQGETITGDLLPEMGAPNLADIFSNIDTRQYYLIYTAAEELSGGTLSITTTVPEPATATLSLLALAALAARRRRG